MTRNELKRKLEIFLRQGRFIKQFVNQEKISKILTGKTAYDAIYGFINNVIITDSWLDKYQDDWLSGKDIGNGFKIFEYDILVILSHDENDPNCSVKISKKQIQFIFNLKRFCGQKLDKEKLRNYFQEKDIINPLSYGILHLVQFDVCPYTHDFEDNTFKILSFTKVMPELETYIGMILTYNFMINNKCYLYSFDEFMKFVNSLSNCDFLSYVINFIKVNSGEVKKFFDKNRSYLSAILKEIKDLPDEINFDEIKIPERPYSIFSSASQKCFKFCINYLHDNNEFITHYFMDGYEELADLKDLQKLRKSLQGLKSTEEEYEIFKKNQNARQLIRQAILKD